MPTGPVSKMGWPLSSMRRMSWASRSRPKRMSRVMTHLSIERSPSADVVGVSRGKSLLRSLELVGRLSSWVMASLIVMAGGGVGGFWAASW